MAADPTWTLTVDGKAYVLDWALGQHIVSAATSSQGHGSSPFDIPGAAKPVVIFFGQDDHWSIVRND